MNVSNVSVGASLAISVSGTARLQKQAGADVAASDLVTHTGETGAQALSHASAATLDAMEQALKKVSPNASVKGYQEGMRFSNGAGTYFSIIA